MIHQKLLNNGKILILKLSSSQKNRNALSLSMIQELQSIFDDVSTNKSSATATASSTAAAGSSTDNTSPPRVIVIDHDGAAFSSGHDLKELVNNSDSENRHLFEACSTMMRTITTIPTPVIAKVDNDGVATAAGCQLVASCDLAYATAGSKFLTPGVNIGLFCSTPGVALARCVSRKHAAEMLLTGRPVSAQRAYEIGLLNGVARNTQELDSMVTDVAETIASKSATAIQTFGKPTFYEQLEARTLEEAYRIANRTMCENLKHPDCQIGIQNFLNKKPTKW